MLVPTEDFSSKSFHTAYVTGIATSVALRALIRTRGPAFYDATLILTAVAASTLFPNNLVASAVLASFPKDFTYFS